MIFSLIEIYTNIDMQEVNMSSTAPNAKKRSHEESEALSAASEGDPAGAEEDGELILLCNFSLQLTLYRVFGRRHGTAITIGIAQEKATNSTL